MLHLRLALQTIPVNYEPCPGLIAVLIYLRQYEHPLYLDIQSRSMGIQKLMDNLEKIIPEELYQQRDEYDKLTPRSTVYTIAQVLVAYAVDERGIEWITLYNKTDDGKIQLTFKSYLPQDVLEEAVEHYSSRNYNVSIGYAVRHIELLCNLQND